MHRLTDRAETVGTAESLTGGLLCAALVAVPGASVVVRGGVVSYAADVKTGVLGVRRTSSTGTGRWRPRPPPRWPERRGRC